MYDKILAPTDGSNVSRRAVKHAAALADRCDSMVHGLFVTDSGSVEKVAGKYPASMHDLEETGHDALAEVEDFGAQFDIPVETAVESGVAHEEIIEYADEHGIDVIVMGTHGRQGVGRYLLGSVTERVVRTADVPVVTVGGQ